MRSYNWWLLVCISLGVWACEATPGSPGGRSGRSTGGAAPGQKEATTGADDSTPTDQASEHNEASQAANAPSQSESSGGQGGEPNADDGGQPPASTGCTAVTAETYENNEGNDAEFTAKFFPTKDRDNEYIDMFFRSAQLGTHAYGAGNNADLYTCDQCLLVVRNGKNFYPSAGTITVLPGSEATKKKLVAKLSQLTLVEIQITSSYHSVKVPGGECITLAPSSINVL